MFKLGTILISLLAMCVVLAQPNVPDTPAGRYLADFLAIYNQADPQLARDFAEERLSPDFLEALGGPDGAVRALAELYLEVGPLEPAAFKGESTHELTVFAQGIITKTWVYMDVKLDPGAPSRVLSQTIDSAGPPPDAEPTVPQEGEALAEALGAYLDILVAHDYFSGVVLVAKDGVPVFQVAYGRRNEAGEAITLESKFALASMSKMFTALAVAQLVENGKISFDDPVSRYLLSYPGELIEDVTIHHLLSHTSGLGGFDFEEIKDKTDVEEMLSLEVERTPFEPGERFVYSNIGYVLLGAIIERVSGEDYYTYIQDHVLNPLGMHDSGAMFLGETTPGYATGFVPDLGAWLAFGDTKRVANEPFRVSVGSPAGDFLATAPDLLRFAEGLRRHKLIGADTFNTLATPRMANYGYGFQTFPNAMVGHNGGAAGESTHFAIDLDEGYTVIVLSNYDRAAGAVVRYIDQLLGL